MLRFNSCLPINDLIAPWPFARNSFLAISLFPVRILQDPCPTGKYYRPYVRYHQADWEPVTCLDDSVSSKMLEFV